MLYLDVELAPGSSHSAKLPEEQHGIVYVVSGEVQVGDASARAGEALAVGMGEVNVSSGPGGRYLLVSGRPSGEPVTLRGPYVD
jgi:redox-sensitive bicupin YhaK (pirin superfamily)